MANTDAPPIQSFIISNKVIYYFGTPISNLMIELYTIQRYLQYSALKNCKLLKV